MAARTVLFTAAILATGQTCYWNNKCNYNYFGSKTVYDNVRGDIRDVPEVKGCTPVGVWAFIRHGTRHPTSGPLLNILSAAGYRYRIVKSHREGRGQLCAQDISNLQTWTLKEDVSEATAGFLTAGGYQELYQLGARLHERFLPLLKEVDRYDLRPTLEQRTIESAKAFVEGLTQNLFTFTITNATDVDDVLRPYKYCNRHRVEAYEGARAKEGINNYPKTEEFQKLITNVQHRSGLDEPLTPLNVTGLYDLCRYFTAYSGTSPWCALFTHQELEVMEYLADLDHYYRNAYGTPINLELGKTALKDLFGNFRNLVQGSNKSFAGYFSHDSMLEMMYAALGLFRDYPEISGFERNPSRKWRTTFITPFAANFIVVLHKCSNQTSPPNYQVQFLINEKEFHLCSARTCSWSEFVAKFEPFLDSSLDVCHLETTTSAPEGIQHVNVTQIQK